MNTTQSLSQKDPVIEVVDLRCNYGAYEAVRGISFAVQRGELLALLGTNGAGKTTTMETMEGHRQPDGGTVRVLGMDPARDRRKVRASMGIMLQESGFVGELTVAETVHLWAKLRSRPSAPDAVIGALDLEHRRGVRVSQLSGGEKRRLDLALAVLGDPEILFLDEPTTGLDPESRQRVWTMIRTMLDAGTTVVLTTHYLEEAEALADHLAILHEGRIAVSGTMAELLSSRRARIGFDVPDGVSSADLPPVAGTIDPVALSKGRFEGRTGALQDDLTTLVEWARRRKIELRRLRAQHASLADLFTEVSQGGAIGEGVDTGADGLPGTRGGGAPGSDRVDGHGGFGMDGQPGDASRDDCDQYSDATYAR